MDFCELCRRCLVNCPSQAIARDSSLSADGKKYWENDEIKCISMWASTGYSCGVCMSACPFSQGVDQELVRNMKGNKDVMLQILKEHQAKHGKRACIDTPLPHMPPTHDGKGWATRE